MQTAFQMNENPLAGSSFLIYPLEGHAFAVDPRDDYRCRLCHRPRALHAGPPEPVLEPEPRRPRAGHHKTSRSPNGQRRA